MADDLVPKIDLIKDSMTYLLTVSFGKSSSPSYPLAVSVAKGADKYDELKLAGNTVHLVAFNKSRDGAARATSLLLYIAEWKSTQIYGGGKLLQDYYRISEVLRCYLTATACEDWQAHCHLVVDDPFKDPSPVRVGRTLIISMLQFADSASDDDKIDRYIFPCRLLSGYFRNRTKEHPSDPIHQIQAVAIDHSYDICPFFNPRGYKKIEKEMA